MLRFNSCAKKSHFFHVGWNKVGFVFHAFFICVSDVELKVLGVFKSNLKIDYICQVFPLALIFGVNESLFVNILKK